MSASPELLTVAVPECRCVAVSPDGTGLLTAAADGVRLRDTSDGTVGWTRAGELPAELPVEAVWGAGGDSVTLLAGGALALLDAVTGAGRPIPEELTARTDITAVALSPDGLVLAVGTREGFVLLWRQDLGQVSRLRGGGDPVTALSWRPSGSELCVARPRSIQFWLLRTETMIWSIDAGDVRPTRLAWAPDSDRIVVTGLHDIRVISLGTRAESAPPLITGGRPCGLGFSRTGAILLAGAPDGSVLLLDRRLQPAGPGAGRLAAALTEPATLHVNESGLVAARTDAGTVTLFRLADTSLPDPEVSRQAALQRWAAATARAAPAGPGVDPPVPSTVATLAGFDWSPDGWYVQDLDGGELSRIDSPDRPRWTTHAGVGPLAADQRFVAVGDGDSRIAVLDARTGAHLAAVAGAGRVSWTGDGFATAAPRRRDVLVYGLDWVARTLPVPDGAGDPAYSPDGRLLAAGTPGSVVVWNAGNLTRIRRLDVGRSSRPVTVAWSPDGGLLALDRPGGPVTVWRVSDWRPAHTLGRSPGGGRPPPAWSPDSRLLAVPAARPVGAVDLWDVRRERIVLTVPPPPDRGRPVTRLAWAADGRFAVGHDDGTVVRWELTLPEPDDDEPARSPYPVPVLASLVTATAVRVPGLPLSFLADLLSLLLGRDAGPLAEFDRHPGVARLRGLRWPPAATVGLVALVADGLPADDSLRVRPGTTPEEIREAVATALAGTGWTATRYEVPAALRTGLDGIDDSVLLLASLLGPDVVAAAPELLARVHSQSFGRWNLAPQQRHLLGLRSMVSSIGGSQGHGLGDTRAGVARHGQLPALLPSQLALPRTVLALKKSRDELLFRTRQGDLPVEAQPVVLLLDDTPPAFGAVGVTLRVIANLLAGAAIQKHRRCALVPLSTHRAVLLTERSDLVHLWAGGQVEPADLPAALAAATRAADQLSDAAAGLPRLVLLTHPYRAAPGRPSLHVVRVHYPGIPVGDRSPRTHVLAPDAGAEEIHQVIATILSS